MKSTNKTLSSKIASGLGGLLVLALVYSPTFIIYSIDPNNPSVSLDTMLNPPLHQPTAQALVMILLGAAQGLFIFAPLQRATRARQHAKWKQWLVCALAGVIVSAELAAGIHFKEPMVFAFLGSSVLTLLALLNWANPPDDK